MVMLADGRAAPEASCAVPTMLPETAWPKRVALKEEV
jgi:hypothetical protein